MATLQQSEWLVTPEKVEEAVRRIVEAANPLQVIVFGSRARGDHRVDSDLDLAVILDGDVEFVYQRVPYTLLSGLRMEVDMVVVAKAKYDEHRIWRNSVYHNIYRQGIVLYDRDNPERARPNALRDSGEGRIRASVSAA